MTRVVQTLAFVGGPLLLIVAPLLGQAPATAPTTADTVERNIIDNLDVPNAISLAEFMPLLQRKAPWFQYVAKSGDWEASWIPPLHLRNVTLGQVLVLLANLEPALVIDKVPAGTEFQGNPMNVTNQIFGQPNAEVPNATGTIYVFKDSLRNSGTPPTKVRVQAFGLANVVDNQALRMQTKRYDASKHEGAPDQFAKDRAQALADILSLLQAAITQASVASESAAEPLLKLHNETEVLLVKGTDKQIAAVSDALDALKVELAQWQGKTPAVQQH